jgi:hypothetical protein
MIARRISISLITSLGGFLLSPIVHAEQIGPARRVLIQPWLADQPVPRQSRLRWHRATVPGQVVAQAAEPIGVSVRYLTHEELLDRFPDQPAALAGSGSSREFMVLANAESN